jgi:hypothetical protein
MASFSDDDGMYVNIVPKDIDVHASLVPVSVDFYDGENECWLEDGSATVPIRFVCIMDDEGGGDDEEEEDDPSFTWEDMIVNRYAHVVHVDVSLPLDSAVVFVKLEDKTTYKRSMNPYRAVTNTFYTEDGRPFRFVYATVPDMYPVVLNNNTLPVLSYDMWEFDQEHNTVNLKDWEKVSNNVVDKDWGYLYDSLTDDDFKDIYNTMVDLFNQSEDNLEDRQHFGEYLEGGDQEEEEEDLEDIEEEEEEGGDQEED